MTSNLSGVFRELTGGSSTRLLEEDSEEVAVALEELKESGDGEGVGGHDDGVIMGGLDERGIISGVDDVEEPRETDCASRRGGSGETTILFPEGDTS